MATPRGVLLGILLVLLAVAFTLGPGVWPEAASAQAGLFSDSPRYADANPPNDATIVRSNYVTVNFSLLDGPSRVPRVAGGGATTVTLNLFPGVTLTAVRYALEPTASGQGFIWFGRVQGSPNSQVILVVEGNTIAGNIDVDFKHYQVRYAGVGVHAIYEIDEFAFPPDEHVYPPPLPRVAPGAKEGSAPPTTSADDGSTIDVMVVYTRAFLDAVGGTAAATSLINLAAADVNTAYANSQVTQRLRIVYGDLTTYTESGKLNRDLENLRDGNVPGAAAIRNQVGADLVSLWVKDDAPNATCGLGYIMADPGPSFANFAFSVVEQRCAAGNHGFAHELGHNMGACHDWITDGRCQATRDYAHGYISPNNTFHTIMAYFLACNSCPGIPNFSNPNVTFNGVATGVAGGAQPADNHRVFNETASIVANFRQCVVNCGGVVPSPTPTRSPTPIPAGPPNDNFANAQAVTSLPARFTGNTAAATIEPGEPTPTACAASIGHSVWYRLSLPTTQRVTIATLGSDFDSVVAVYMGSSLTSLAQLGCNDDFQGKQSQLSLVMSAGVVYYVQVSSFGSSAGGSLALDITGAAPSCPSRPNIQVTSRPSATNDLSVVISAPNLPGGAPNALFAVRVGAISGSAAVIAGDQTYGSFTSFALAPNTTQTSLTVRRQVAGAVTVPLTVVDACGDWPTFVGGGTNAF